MVKKLYVFHNIYFYRQTVPKSNIKLRIIICKKCLAALLGLINNYKEYVYYIYYNILKKGKRMLCPESGSKDKTQITYITDQIDHSIDDFSLKAVKIVTIHFNQLSDWINTFFVNHSNPLFLFVSVKWNQVQLDEPSSIRINILN